MNPKAIPNHVIQGQFLSSECFTAFFSCISPVISVITVVFPVCSVSFDPIAFSVRFETVKLVDFNEIEPKASSDVEFVISSFVVAVDDIVDDVDVVEVVKTIVEFSAVVVFFRSIILFMSGKMFIVAKLNCKQTSARTFFQPFISEFSSSSHEQFFAVTTINKISFTIILNISLFEQLAKF